MRQPCTEGARALPGRFAVRTKLSGIVLALTTILGLGITLQVRKSRHDLMRSELAVHGQTIAIELAHEVETSVKNRDLASTTESLDEEVQSHPDRVYATVVDAAGELLARSVDTQVIECDIALGPPPSPGASTTSIHEFSAPIADGALGTVTVGMSDTRLREATDALTVRLLLTTLLVGAIGIGAATFLTWLLTRPIVDLVHTTHRVSHGDRSARATVWAEDENGALA